MITVPLHRLNFLINMIAFTPNAPKKVLKPVEGEK